MKIWLLEDDVEQARLLMGWMTNGGHQAMHFPNSGALLDELRKDQPELFVLDWELPDGTGLEVLQRIRDHMTWHVPVLFVTQRDSEADIVDALSAGADDYMVKQIKEGEFLARLTALGRRLGNQSLEFSIGPYTFMPNTHSVTKDGDPVDLTVKDFELAHYLFRNVDRLLSREELLKEIWGVSGVNTRTVDMHMSRIRKIARYPTRIGV